MRDRDATRPCYGSHLGPHADLARRADQPFDRHGDRQPHIVELVAAEQRGTDRSSRPRSS
ncbi:hypothetical protein P3W85_24425 [Cupriavidus basilensis]|uniref:Uncharacterized protein n=1 Tax=Cupriavidus basilensis TaxID=68895 RepID=A0ABT6ATZ9_9BURK|nr:hypothetical protein [Cupriavidus basilensis]MDF3836073.1 hypothetical protein [Cupriavidus basilensis]